MHGMMVINMFLWNIQLNRLLVEDGLSLFTCISFPSEAGCDGEVSLPGPLLWKWVSSLCLNMHIKRLTKCLVGKGLTGMFLE